MLRFQRMSVWLINVVNWSSKFCFEIFDRKPLPVNSLQTLPVPNMLCVLFALGHFFWVALEVEQKVRCGRSVTQRTVMFCQRSCTPHWHRSLLGHTCGEKPTFWQVCGCWSSKQRAPRAPASKTGPRSTVWTLTTTSWKQNKRIWLGGQAKREIRYN